MLRLVTQRAGFVNISGCLTFGFINTYYFVLMTRSSHSGSVWMGSWGKDILQKQRTSPIRLGKHDGKTYWAFRDRFYWTADDLSYEDVTALLLEGEIKKRQKIERAKSVLNGYMQNKNAVPQLTKENKLLHTESRLQETEKLNQILSNTISELKNILQDGINGGHSMPFEEAEIQNEPGGRELEKAYKNSNANAISKYYSIVLLVT